MTASAKPSKQTPVKRAPAKRAAPRKAAAKVAGTTGGRSAARKAVERAKRAGAIGPFGTDAQRAMRDGAVLSMLAAGSTQASVASELGVSLRTVQAVVAAQRSARSILDEIPMEVVETFVRSMRRRIAEFQVMAHAHADANPSVGVAALKGAQASEERLIDVLVSLGKLPDNLELYRAESELRSLVDELVGTMGDLRDGEITVEEAYGRFLQMIEPAEAKRQRALASP